MVTTVSIDSLPQLAKEGTIQREPKRDTFLSFLKLVLGLFTCIEREREIAKVVIEENRGKLTCSERGGSRKVGEQHRCYF